MDGLSVSVVPRERSGMASGIFNTSKVANEGIAIATAGLGFMTASFIAEGAHLPYDQVRLSPEAGQNIVAGDLKKAMQLLPGLSRETLAQAYFDAFQYLSRGLAALTAFAALVILALLGKSAKTPTPAKPSIAPAE